MAMELASVVTWYRHSQSQLSLVYILYLHSVGVFP